MKLSDLLIKSAFEKDYLNASFSYQEEAFEGNEDVKDLLDSQILSAIQFLLLHIAKVTADIESERLKRHRSEHSLWQWKTELEQFPFRFNWNFRNPHLNEAFLVQRLYQLENDQKFCLQLLGHLARFYSGDSKDLPPLNDIKNLCKSLSDFQKIAQVGHVSFLKRNWLNLVIIFAGAHFGRSFFEGLDWKMMAKLTADMWVASRNILQNWIFQPLLEIWETIRYSKSNIRITDAESITSEIDALNRMVSDYNSEYLPSASQIDFDSILREYEQSLKAPIRNAVLGNLVRLLLIQIQKAKVDLGTAMLSLDKLMRANELNFEMLAVIPLMTFLAFGWSKGKEIWLRLASRSRSNLIDEYNWAMRNMDLSLMSDDPQDNEYVGRRIFYSFQLGCIWNELNCSSKLTRAFKEDLGFLIDPQVTLDKRFLTLNRMRSFYKF